MMLVLAPSEALDAVAERIEPIVAVRPKSSSAAVWHIENRPPCNKFNFSAGPSLVAIGGGGLVYFYLLTPTRDGCMVLV